MLSIISANYNKEEVLPDFFQSVFNNGFTDFELIFVDDCSTDSSVEIAKKFPCRIIQNKTNIGPAASRNLAAKQARGDILVFTDTDITIDPGGLALISKKMQADKIDAMFGKLAFPPLRNTKIGRFWLYDENEVCHYGGVKTGMVNCWSSTLGIVKRALFLRIGGFNETFKGADIEDHELAAKILNDSHIYYDENLTFHHHYPSTKLVLKKMFIRSKMFARSTSIKVYKEKSWVSKHRNASFILSFIMTILFLSLPISLFTFHSLTIPLICLIVLMIIIKTVHHRFLFKSILKTDGFGFAVYSFFMLYVTSIFAMSGFMVGIISGKERLND